MKFLLATTPSAYSASRSSICVSLRLFLIELNNEIYGFLDLFFPVSQFQISFSQKAAIITDSSPRCNPACTILFHSYHSLICETRHSFQILVTTLVAVLQDLGYSLSWRQSAWRLMVVLPERVKLRDFATNAWLINYCCFKGIY